MQRFKITFKGEVTDIKEGETFIKANSEEEARDIYFLIISPTMVMTMTSLRLKATKNSILQKNSRLLNKPLKVSEIKTLPELVIWRF